MKRFLSIGMMFALALVVGVISAPRAQGDILDIGGGFANAQKQLEEQLASFDEAIRAAYEAGSFSSTVKSISVSATGGYACEGGTVRGATGRGFLVTAANGRKAIFTAASEDVLKRTFSAAMAAQLAGLNVSFVGMPTACANVSNAAELIITK